MSEIVGKSRFLHGECEFYSEGPNRKASAGFLCVYGSSEGSIRTVPQFLLTMGDDLCEELEDLVHFSVHDLPTRGYVVMEEIRRQGKLCDVTLKVIGPTAGVSMLARLTVPSVGS